MCFVKERWAGWCGAPTSSTVATSRASAGSRQRSLVGATETAAGATCGFAGEPRHGLTRDYRLTRAVTRAPSGRRAVGSASRQQLGLFPGATFFEGEHENSARAAKVRGNQSGTGPGVLLAVRPGSTSDSLR